MNENTHSSGFDPDNELISYIELNGTNTNPDSILKDKNESTARIDSLIRDIRNTVRRVDPAELLRWAFWRKVSHQKQASESQLGETPEYLLSMRMIDYIQSIIASTPMVPCRRRSRLS
jgi:hypothetical protein